MEVDRCHKGMLVQDSCEPPGVPVSTQTNCYSNALCYMSFPLNLRTKTYKPRPLSTRSNPE